MRRFALLLFVAVFVPPGLAGGSSAPPAGGVPSLSVSPYT